MSKKDYELIAGQLCDSYSFAKRLSPEAEQVIVSTVNRLSRVFWLQNYRFDFKKFYKACGIEAEKIPEQLNF